MDSRYRRPIIFFALLLVFTLLVNIVPQIPLTYAATQVTVNSKVNFRAGPSTTYKILGSVVAGERLTTLKTDKGWLNVQKANDTKGWVAGWLTVPVSGTTPQPSRGTTPVAGKIVTVKGDYANVRSGPGTSYSKVGTINKGQQSTFVKESKGWYNIKLANGKLGWVAGWLVQVKQNSAPASGQVPADPATSTTPAGKIIVVKGSYLNVRSGPGTNYGKVTTIDKGQQFPVIKESNGWYNIKLANGNPGWVAGWLVQVKAPTPVPSRGEQPLENQLILVTGSEVNVRSGPGTQYPVITSLVKGIQAPLIKQQNGWCNIQLFGGRNGWVIESLVAIQGLSKPDPKPPVDSGTVPNPGSAPTEPIIGDKFEVKTKKVSEGLQVTFSSDVDLAYNPREITEQNSLVLEISKLTLSKDEDIVSVNDAGLKAVKTKQTGTGAEVTLEFVKLGNYMLIQPDSKSILILIPTPQVTPVPVDNSTSTFQLTQVQSEVPNDDETLVIIQGNGPLTYNKQFLKDPNRLIFDIPNYEPGQVAEFLPVNSSVVNQIRVSLFSTVPKVTRVVIDLAKPCGYTITPSFDQQFLTIALSGKSILAGKKIVIDPGHGDWDPGAVGATGLKEKEVNLDTANRLVQYLQALGAEVIMTRTNDSFVPLADRAAIANELKADIFVSVHANSNTNSAIAGSSTYFYAPTDRPDLANQLDKRRNLAQAVQTEMVKAMGRRDIGILQSKFAVLNATTMPSILVETAFLSNAEEEALLADSANRDKFAEAISRGIVNYFLSN